MKAGYINLISAAPFSGGSNPNYSRDNDSLKVTTLTAATTLTITPAAGILIDFVSIFNFDGTNLEVKVTQSVAGVTTTNLTTADASGWAYSNYLVPVADNTDTVTLIEIKNTGAASADIGYIYAGLWINFGCSEAMQFFDESNDDVTIDRTNRPLYDPRYKTQIVNYTTKKENTSLSDLRTRVRKILDTGYALKRPFLFDEPIFEDELMLGILGSGRVGYDYFQTKNSEPELGQVTIEIREVK